MRRLPNPPRLSLLAAAALLVAMPHGAKAQCDTERLAAEAALLRHTELMVSSLLCDSDPRSVQGTQRPYALYRVFTARHSRIIGIWERQLAARTGQENFDFWRTELANEVVRSDMRRVSTIGIDAYCARAKGAIQAAMRLSGEEVLAFATPEPLAATACAQVQTSERAD